MSDFGELALVVGDFHIPHRAAGIPEKFQRMLVPNKMQRKQSNAESFVLLPGLTKIVPQLSFRRVVHWKRYHQRTVR